jgi:hypothetical protein
VWLKVSPGIIVTPDDQDAGMVALSLENQTVEEFEIPIVPRQANTVFVDGLAEMICVVGADHAQFDGEANIVSSPAE